MTRVPPMKCKKHLIPDCPVCLKQGDPKSGTTKPHGPVSEHLMRHWYGAKR